MLDGARHFGVVELGERNEAAGDDTNIFDAHAAYPDTRYRSPRMAVAPIAAAARSSLGSTCW
jgi:hypothetical protein